MASEENGRRRDESSVWNRLLWLDPHHRRRQGWWYVGRGPRTRYWARGQIRSYSMDDYCRLPELADFRRCVVEFRRVTSVFDRAGDPLDSSFKRPQLELTAIVKCRELR